MEKDAKAARTATYQKAIEKTEKVSRILSSAIQGTSLSKACAAEDVQLMWMRRYIERNIAAVPDVAVIRQEDCEDWADRLWGDMIEDHSLCAPDGFEEMLETVSVECLTEMERTAMYMRYCDEMTMQSIADELKVSKTRIEAVIAKTLRKLRKPQNRLRLQYGPDYEEALKEVGTAQAEYDKAYLKAVRDRKQETTTVIRTLEKQAEKFQEKANELSKASDDALDLESITERKLVGTTLDELGFSVRTYNTFIRHFGRIDISAADIVSLSGKLLYVRGLGRKCAKEVVDIMHTRFGIDMVCGYRENVG